MPTRNIVLTDHQADLIEALVSSGRYQNASEALREGVRLLEKQEAEDRARIDALRDAARAGIEDIESGRFKGFAKRTDLRKHLTALGEEAIVGRGPVIDK